MRAAGPKARRWPQPARMRRHDSICITYVTQTVATAATIHPGASVSATWSERNSLQLRAMERATKATTAKVMRPWTAQSQRRRGELEALEHEHVVERRVGERQPGRDVVDQDVRAGKLGGDVEALVLDVGRQVVSEVAIARADVEHRAPRANLCELRRFAVPHPLFAGVAPVVAGTVELRELRGGGCDPGAHRPVVCLSVNEWCWDQTTKQPERYDRRKPAERPR